MNGIRDNNVEGSEKVFIRESKWVGKGKFTFEKHSFTLLRWKASELMGELTGTAEPIPDGIPNGQPTWFMNGNANGVSNGFPK